LHLTSNPLFLSISLPTLLQEDLTSLAKVRVLTSKMLLEERNWVREERIAHVGLGVIITNPDTGFNELLLRSLSET
jgi:hypothetical protein